MLGGGLPVKSIRDLERLKDTLRGATNPYSSGRAVFLVEMGTAGIAAGAREVVISLMNALRAHGISDCAVVQACSEARLGKPPLVSVILPGQSVVTYEGVAAQDAERIVERHLVGLRVAAG